MTTEQELIEQYKLKHKNGRYGISSSFLFSILRPHITESGAKTILDYGCGQSLLHRTIEYYMNIKVTRFDPAIDGLSNLPEENFDLVLCLDVMEHLLIETVEPTLRIIKSKSDKSIFNINLVPAKQCLPNGLNCHVTLLKMEEWIEILKKYFDKLEVIKMFFSPKYSHSAFMVKTF